MRTVSLLCGVCRLVVIMAWFGINSVFNLIWRTAGFIWRYIRMFGSMVRHGVLRWRKDYGSLKEPERSDEETCAKEEEETCSEGQPEAAVRKRAADTDRELTCKRPRSEEGESEKDVSEEGESEKDVSEDGEPDDEEYRVETSDEFYCEYDSTWETEEQQEDGFRGSRRIRHYKFSRFESAARDMQNYRHNYPSQSRPQHWMKPVSDDKPNLKFYLGLKSSVPDGAFIHDFHNEWYGAYDILEFVHSYIQWLFPLQEPGMNYEASTLTKEEIKEFLQNNTAKENLLKSYRLMLDFYGIELCDEETGEVKRAENWRERFDNLNSHTHNNLRITRILKCLGTLGYPHYQAPLVHFFLEETLVHGELPSVKDSVLSYFVFAVLDKGQRRSLIKFAYLNYDRKDEFVWCPKKIQMKWSQKVMPKKGMNVEYLSLSNEDGAGN
ncbi:opioid growth factor receptor-like [Plectropomus leopardus]|uniref:opioid growth factor receptor-like n=1 Tax=Plectropomus leopardus TaxID=160734 RepID=UPI001C4AE7E1|nr:opioid growth factor receptor-like [Plectropomus leopardus]